MILIDSNILIYAYDETSPHHEAARRWLDGAVAEEDEIAIPLISLLAFMRVMTDPSLFGSPMGVADAGEIVAEWLSLPNVGMVQPTGRHFALLAELAQAGQARGAMMMDAHLAALAIEHVATVCTTDRDFARFKGLRLEDPIGS